MLQEPIAYSLGLKLNKTPEKIYPTQKSGFTWLDKTLKYAIITYKKIFWVNEDSLVNMQGGLLSLLISFSSDLWQEFK